MLYVTSELSEDDKEEIDRLLIHHNLMQTYDVQCVAEKEIKHGKAYVEAGSNIGVVNHAGQVSGSLGCYIYVKESNGDGRKLNVITCAHCCFDIADRVDIAIEIAGNTVWRVLGQVTKLCERKSYIDIAIIEVDEEFQRGHECVLELKRSNELELAETWEPTENIRVNDLVHKVGAVTEFTSGIVSSTDAISRRSVEFKNCYSAGGLQGMGLDDAYTILIEPKGGTQSKCAQIKKKTNKY